MSPTVRRACRYARHAIALVPLGAPLGAPLGLALARPAAAQRAAAPPAVVSSGAGSTTWVLLSGLVGGVAGYGRLEARLVAQGHRVVRVDPYLLSIDSADVTFDALARRVARALDAEGVRSARVVGHAHGGGVALRLAAREPARVESVHLLDVGAQASSQGAVLGASLRLVPLITRLPGGRAFVRARFVKELRASSARTEWLDAATRDAYVEPFLDGIARAVDMAFRLAAAEEPEPVARVLARVRAPVAVLVGAVRTAAGPSEAELSRLAALPMPARIERLPGVAHFPHEEAPDDVARALLRGPARLLAARAAGGEP